VSKYVVGLLVKLVVDYGMVEGSDICAAREIESFRILAFTVVNHIIVTCPFVEENDPRRLIAWMFKALGMRLEGELEMRRVVAHVVCGALQGSGNGCFIDAGILKSGGVVLEKLRRDNSWIVRVVLLDLFREVIGVCDGRPRVNGLILCALF
jgi:hypothetical protein